MMEILECQRWCVEQIQTYYVVADEVLWIQAASILILAVAISSKDRTNRDLLLPYALATAVLYFLVKLYQIFIGML